MDDCVQKYQKVYNFLKRVLSQERYEGIRLVEPCIVVARGFNKLFKYAVLGDEMLYVTENPPKSSKDINMTIDLSSITLVDVVHDCPEFLNGELKNRAQHIVIWHKKPYSRESSTSSVKLALSSSLLGTSPVMTPNALHQVEKGVSLTPSPTRTSYLEVSGTLSEQVRHMRLSASENDIKTRLRHERVTFEGRKRSNSHRPLPVPQSGFETEDYLAWKPQSNVKTVRTSKRKHNRLKSRHKDKNSENNSDFNSSSSSVELESFSNFSCISINDTQVSERLPSPSFSLNSHINQTLPQSDLVKRSSLCSVSSTDESQMDVRKFKGSVSGSSDYILYLSDESGDEIDSAQSVKHLMEVHLYILTEQSPMFMHLRSTWNNCILKSTLLIEGSQSSLYPAASSSTRIQCSKVDNSQLLQLFYQLKSEILQSQHMEKSFVLVQELLTAAQKSFVLKKFFWKSPDLVTFLVNQLHHYLLHSPSSNVKKRKLNRADELDFVVVLLDILTCMFRETEVLIPRLNVLKSNKGEIVHKLVRTIVKTPEVKKDEEGGGISLAAQMLLLNDADQDVFHSQKENEISKLMEEIMDGTSSVMHELILAVHQAKCFASDDNILNICWLMKILESQETGLSFLERMMQRSMALVQCRSMSLPPKEAVLLYRHFYVMQNVLQYSETLAHSFRSAYAEEFRYYIKKNIVRKKLPTSYPVTGPLLLAVEKVSDLVLSPSKSKSFRK